MNRHAYIIRETREKRGDSDHDCEDFERGYQDEKAWCETDGHYECDNCKWNAHQGATKDEMDYRFETSNWPTAWELKKWQWEKQRQ